MTSVSSYISVHIPLRTHFTHFHSIPKTLVSPTSQFHIPTCFASLKLNSTTYRIRIEPMVSRRRRSLPIVRAAQSNLIKVLQTVFKVGKDGIEAGTNLVPDSVPRPVARISVSVIALSLALFVLKSFLSTAFFALCTMGLVYFIFLAVNKGDDPPGGDGGGGGGSKGFTSTDDSLEEARRIMDKYK